LLPIVYLPVPTIYGGYIVLILLFLVFTFVKLGNNELLPSFPLLELNTFGDLYYAFGSLSVKENIFLLNLIVFNIISFYSLVSGKFKL
jgi:hypothetical protein